MAMTKTDRFRAFARDYPDRGCPAPSDGTYRADHKYIKASGPGAFVLAPTVTLEDLGARRHCGVLRCRCWEVLERCGNSECLCREAGQ